MSARQEDAKGVSMSQNRTVVSVLPTPSKPLNVRTYLRQRVLTLLAGSTDFWPGPLNYAWRWWALRQAVGGRWSSDCVRETVDGLLDEGLVIEFWQAIPDRRPPRHWLILTRYFVPEEWAPFLEVRGRADLLDELNLRDHLQLDHPVDEELPEELDVWGSKRTLLRQLGLTHLAEQISDEDDGQW